MAFEVQWSVSSFSIQHKGQRAKLVTFDGNHIDTMFVDRRNHSSNPGHKGDKLVCLPHSPLGLSEQLMLVISCVKSPPMSQTLFAFMLALLLSFVLILVCNHYCNQFVWHVCVCNVGDIPIHSSSVRSSLVRGTLLFMRSWELWDHH